MKGSAPLGASDAWLRLAPGMNLGQVRLIEADILVIVESIGEDTAAFDLGQQPLDIDAVIGGTAGGEEVDGGGEKITGAEDITLLQVVASGGKLHEPMKKIGILPGFVGDQFFEIVMAFQKGAAVEELDPSL
jgi:hypothetical protein